MPFIENIETARKQSLVSQLASIYQSMGDFRLKGLHTIDEVDSRFVAKMTAFADEVENEINRLGEIFKKKAE